MFLRLLAVLGTQWLVGQLWAHEYWLEPQRSRDGQVAVRLMLGPGLWEGEEKATQKRRVAALRLLSPQAEVDLLPELAEGAKPLLVLEERRLARGGLLALERTPARITLDHVKFNAYLRQEALVKAILERTRAREMGRAGRERYTRYLKLFLPARGVRSARSDASTRVLGQTLEIVPESPLGRLRKGRSLTVRVLFEQAPLANVTVSLARRPHRGETARITQVTDAEGRATFAIAGAGLHALRLVHMRRLVGGDPTDFRQPEWESFWASYVFPVRSR